MKVLLLFLLFGMLLVTGCVDKNKQEEKDILTQQNKETNDTSFINTTQENQKEVINAVEDNLVATNKSEQYSKLENNEKTSKKDTDEVEEPQTETPQNTPVDSTEYFTEKCKNKGGVVAPKDETYKYNTEISISFADCQNCVNISKVNIICVDPLSNKELVFKDMCKNKGWIFVPNEEAKNYTEYMPPPCAAPNYCFDQYGNAQSPGFTLNETCVNPNSKINKTCPANCDDGNPCTEEKCDESTNYQCVKTNLIGEQNGCGGTKGCMTDTCVAGSCLAQAVPNCRGNGICEEGEHWDEDYFPSDCADYFNPKPIVTCNLTGTVPNIQSYYMDEKYIYAGGYGSNTIKVYDWTGNQKFELNGIKRHHFTTDSEYIYGVEFSSVSAPWNISVWNKNSFSLIKTKSFDTNEGISSVAGIDAQYLYLRGYNLTTDEKYLLIYDKNSLEKVMKINSPNQNIKTDQNYIYDLSNSFKAWSKTDGSLIHSFSEQKSGGIFYYNQLEVDSKYIYVLDSTDSNWNGGVLRIFNKTSFELKHTVGTNNAVYPPISLASEDKYVYTIGYGQLYSSSGKKGINIFEKNTGGFLNVGFCQFPSDYNGGWLLYASENKIFFGGNQIYIFSINKT